MAVEVINDQRRFPLTDSEAIQLREAMLDTFFRGWDAAYLSSPQGQRDIEDLVFRRYDECANVIVPWIERHLSLAGRAVVEVGCGAGCSTSAIARFAASVDGYDIDGVGIEAARTRASILGQENVTVHLAQSQDVLPAIRSAHSGGVDVVLLYAVLEHQTVGERLETIRACWDLLRPGGLLVVVETPNRLVYFDPHTSLMPFFSMLPAELAVRCAGSSPRKSFAESMASGLAASESSAVESLARWGRGVSYHEFEVALGDLTSLVVGDGYDPEIISIRPITFAERCLFTYWNHAGVRAPIGFVRQDLDLIFRKPGGPVRPVRERPQPIHALCDPPPDPPPSVRKWWSR
jgi:2-polyprenyl-3-methyl-5-hydroxy-6-metoxy-1,4-benzoquinol methylase